nr:hypothetical protein [Mycoplasmopsis bovis]
MWWNQRRKINQKPDKNQVEIKTWEKKNHKVTKSKSRQRQQTDKRHDEKINQRPRKHLRETLKSNNNLEIDDSKINKKLGKLSKRLLITNEVR